MGTTYPKLLHPVNVNVVQISTSTTAYDEDAREPIQQAAREASFTIKGQVKYGSSKDQSYGSGGPKEDERGYVLFRQRDLDRAGVTLGMNDRITRIGKIDHDVYVTRLEPTGHYSEFGNTLIKAFFADRQPSKHRRRTA